MAAILNMKDSHASHLQAAIPCVYGFKWIRQQNTHKKTFPMESVTKTKEAYHIILNALLEFPSMPDTGEPGVILADGEQRKSDTEWLGKLLAGVIQYLSEYEKLELVTFFHFVFEGDVNI